MRPASIVQFERLYLGSLVIGLIGTVLAWRGNTERLANSVTTAQVSGWIQPATTVFTLVVTLALWYFVARRASLVAKWITVILAAIGVLLAVGALLTLLAGRSPNAVATSLSLVAAGTAAAAAMMLFRSDARAWLGEGAASDQAGPLA